MALVEPTLDELVARIIGDIDTTSPELFASVVRSPMNVFATAEAGIAKGLYGYITNLFKQALPTDATGLNLEKWGRLFGITKLPATKAEPTISVAATANGTILEGVMWRRADGALYEVVEDFDFVIGANEIPLAAVVAGVAGSVDADVELTLTETVAGLARVGEVVDDVEGEDVENEEAYRVRILNRTRSVPQGGAAADYVKWALEVAGVGKAWVITSSPPYVDIRIVGNDPDDLEPTPQLVADVQAYIEDPVRKPVTAIPVVQAIDLFAQAVNITALTPNNATTRAAVLAALKSFYRSPAIQNPNVTVYDTAVVAAIQSAAGVVTFTKAAPTSNINYGPAAFPELGTVTIVGVVVYP